MRVAGRGAWSVGGSSWRVRSPWVRASLLAATATAWAVLLGQGLAAQECAINWRQASPCPTYSALTLNDLAYDGHMFVGVGNGGLVVTSTDGRTWTQRLCHIDADLTTVAAGNGRFVATGMAYPGGPPVTLTSRDGIDWSVGWGIGAQSLQSAGGLFFTGNMTSPDGRQWTPHYLPTDDPFSSLVAHGNGTWLQVQSTPGSANAVFTSADAGTWRLMPVPPFEYVASLVFGGRRFVVQSDAIYSSQNGRAWTKSTGGPPWGAPTVYAGTQFAIVTQRETWFSKDGKAWHGKPSDMPSNARVSHVFWTGSAFVAFGDQGQMTQFTFESPDGLHWTPRPLWGGPSGWGGMVRYFEEPGLFVSAGTLATSPDGEHWSEPATPGSASAVAYGDDTFVAVSTQGSALWSHDGQTWTPVATGFSENLYDVAYGAGLFVAVGQLGRVLTSPDGQVWTTRPSYYYSDLQSIVFAEGTFLAVGYNSSSGLVSSDGITWHSVGLGLNFTAYPGPTTSYALGHFLVASPDGLVASEEARNWTYLGSPWVIGNVVEWNGRAYAPGYGSGEMTSADLQTWTPVPTNGLDRPGQGQSLATDGSVLVLGGPGLLRGTRAPMVDTVTPDRTPAGAPSTVILEGGGFAPVTRVRFGEVPATSFTVLSDSRIEAVAPPLSPDTLAVTADAEDEPGVVTSHDVLRAGGEPVVYGACPTVLSVDPSYFHMVSIWGKGLSEVTDFTATGAFMGGLWGGSEDSRSYWIWPTVLGPSVAEVTLRDGSTRPVPGGLTFVAPPVITAVKVIRSPFKIKVTGTGFTADDAVSLNGVLLPAKLKNPQSLSVSGSAIFRYVNPQANSLRIESCVGAVYSNEVSFVP